MGNFPITAFPLSPASPFLTGAIAILAAMCLAGALDDLFIDAWYWTRRTWRRRLADERYTPITEAALLEKAEQQLAVIVPAWGDQDAIVPTLEKILSVLAYDNYDIFVGTYLNDAATTQQVEQLAARHPRLHRVEVPHAGPTCEADRLNWLIESVFGHEASHDREYAGVVLHGSQDVLHPLELSFFNYLLPRMDMIQLPVASVQRGWHEVVAGSLMDEFAESHAKDMVVRQSVAGMVPSEGTGTCISRHALQALVAATHNKPFATATPAPAYELGTRLARMGMRTIFAVFPVSFSAGSGGAGRREDSGGRIVRMPLCVRKCFPDGFAAACAMKAERVLGVGILAWQRVPLDGRLSRRYLLLHDRKCAVMPFFHLPACMLAIGLALAWAGHVLGMGAGALPALPAPGSVARTLAELAAGALALRCLQRCYFTGVLYGWAQGVMALPRMFVSAILNFFAAGRAWQLYMGYLVRGGTLTWDESRHPFPNSAGLQRRRRRLGELLESWQALEQAALGLALAEQEATRVPLGRILVSNGWLDEETLAEAIAYQAHLPRARLSEKTVIGNAGRLRVDFSTRYRAVCIGSDGSGRPILAVASPLPEEALLESDAAFGVAPLQYIVRESEIAIALRLLRGAGGTFAVLANASGGVPLLGDMLVEQRLIEREDFEAALRDYRPDRHGRVGDFLVERQVLSRDVIERVVEQQDLLHAAMSRGAYGTA